MGLLFAGGVMNLLWIAAIAIFVLLEKTIPFGVNGGRRGSAGSCRGTQTARRLPPWPSAPP
jgi:predicted metal-binding membrane protein